MIGDIWVATFSTRGQLTLPKSLCEYLRLQLGDTIDVEPEEDGISFIAHVQHHVTPKAQANLKSRSSSPA